MWWSLKQESHDSSRVECQHSNINGNSGTGRVYVFYAFDELPEYQP